MTFSFPTFDPPTNASLDGPRVDALFNYTARFVSITLAVVIFALISLIFLFRARPGHRATYQRGDSRIHFATVVAVAAIVFAGMDLRLIGLAHADLRDHFWHRPSGPQVFRVEIMAQQFAWNVRYPGPDDRFNTPDDLVTLNDLRVALDTPVSVQLVAKDVIHSFFLPNFRIKQDAIPGRMTQTWFQATRLGQYEIACAQLCGFAHYQMRGVLHVLPHDAYQQWLHRTAQDAQRSYVPDDVSAHWGWDWHD